MRTGRRRARIGSTPIPISSLSVQQGRMLVSTQDFKDCGGFDDTTPPILVVPLNGTNQVQLKVEGAFLQSNAWKAVTLQSDTPSVTINPSAPTASTTVFTISGGATAFLARIKAINSNGNNLATLRVAVKAPPQITNPAGITLDPQTLNATLDLYPVYEPVDKLTPTVPTAASVLSELQQTLGKHTNIPFAVNLMPQISVHYDLNGDGMLAYTGQDPSTNNEALTISYDLGPSGPNPANSSHYQAAYVNQIVAPQEGFGSDPLMFIRNQTNSGQPYVTAHELGHSLCIVTTTGTCLSHNTADQKDLMTPKDPAGGWAPCRLHAFEWNILNPTGNPPPPGQPAPQWELAPPQPQDQ